MAATAELVDRAAVLPPGPELSAVLGALPWEKVPNARLVEVAQARARQLAHEQAELFAGLVEITHAVAVNDLSSGLSEAVARSGERFEWASHEVAAGLTWTPGAADRELTFATVLVERLPLVFASLQQGLIDRGKARVFVEYLDPANGDVSEEQGRRLCERFVPQAPGLTTKQLSDRLYRALIAIDPELRRRRYRRAVRERGVALYLDPRAGTATLVGDGLPADEAAAAAERLDRLVEAAKRAGHPGRRAQISADLYLGMLNGEYHGLSESEIIDRLLAASRSEDDPDTDSTIADDGGVDDGGVDDGGVDDGGVDDGGVDDGAVDDGAVDDGAVDDGVVDDGVVDDGVVDDGVVDDGVVDDGAVDDGAVDDGAVDDGAVDDGAVDDEAADVACARGTDTGAGAGGDESEPGDDAQPARDARPARDAHPAHGAEPGEDVQHDAEQPETRGGTERVGDGTTGRATDQTPDRATDMATDGATDGATGRTGGDTGPGEATGSSDGENAGRWAGDRVATREGIEIRVGLGTLAGLDDRPGEIPGLGPVGADTARAAVAAQRRGASWRFAVVDTRGYLLLAGAVRRRPRNLGERRSGAGRVRGGVVEVHVTVEELHRYATDPALGDWHGVLSEIAAHWADRDGLRRRLGADPRARFARGPLAEHVRIRDRSCCGPGCTRSARRSDLDHTWDHALGGDTVEVNIGPACKRHHPDKERGWSLTQPEPGRFRWVSPLGRIYWTHGEPVRPDLPDPDPAPPSDKDTDKDTNKDTGTRADHRPRGYDPRILHRPAKDPPRPPPPNPDPSSELPPF